MGLEILSVSDVISQTDVLVVDVTEQVLAGISGGTGTDRCSSDDRAVLAGPD